MMKKFGLTLIMVVTLSYGHIIFAKPNWNGFYMGGNAGYWQSQNNKVTTTSSASFINPVFEPGASNIVNALVQIADNKFSLRSNGFIGGGQVGYNYPFCTGFLLGFNMDFDGLTHSNNTDSLQKTVNLVDFDESYAATLVVKQKINYLGTVRARAGYLFYPTILIYASGGFAYGNVTLNSSWTAQESLGPAVFPTIAAQNNVSKTLTGWTAGIGIEWLFQPNWSTSLEYTYYKLNGFHTYSILAQTNTSLSPPVLWGSATAKTNLTLSSGTIRLGINYHF